MIRVELLNGWPVTPATSAQPAVKPNGIIPSIKACAQVTSAVGGCLSPYQYCETVNDAAWRNNNHQTCTAIKANARVKYLNEHPGCAPVTNTPCYPY